MKTLSINEAVKLHGLRAGDIKNFLDLNLPNENVAKIRLQSIFTRKGVNSAFAIQYSEDVFNLLSTSLRDFVDNNQQEEMINLDTGLTLEREGEIRDTIDNLSVDGTRIQERLDAGVTLQNIVDVFLLKVLNLTDANEINFARNLLEKKVQDALPKKKSNGRKQETREEREKRLRKGQETVKKKRAEEKAKESRREENARLREEDAEFEDEKRQEYERQREEDYNKKLFDRAERRLKIIERGERRKKAEEFYKERKKEFKEQNTRINDDLISNLENDIKRTDNGLEPNVRNELLYNLSNLRKTSPNNREDLHNKIQEVKKIYRRYRQSIKNAPKPKIKKEQPKSNGRKKLATSIEEAIRQQTETNETPLARAEREAKELEDRRKETQQKEKNKRRAEEIKAKKSKKKAQKVEAKQRREERRQQNDQANVNQSVETNLPRQENRRLQTNPPRASNDPRNTPPASNADELIANPNAANEANIATTRASNDLLIANIAPRQSLPVPDNVRF